MTRHLRYLALVAAIAVALAACGNGDDSPFAPGASDSASSSDGDASGGDGSGDVDVGDLLDELPDEVGDLPGVSGECEALLSLFLSIGNAFFGGEVASIDDSALAGLPGDVQADAQLLAETLSEFSDAIAGMGIDFADPESLATLSAEQQQELASLTESLDTEQFNAAADNLEAYGEQQCEEFSPG